MASYEGPVVAENRAPSGHSAISSAPPTQADIPKRRERAVVIRVSKRGGGQPLGQAFLAVNSVEIGGMPQALGLALEPFDQVSKEMR